MKLSLFVIRLNEGLLQPLDAAAHFAIFWPVQQVLTGQPGGHHAPQPPEAALLASLAPTLEPGLVV